MAGDFEIMTGKDHDCVLYCDLIKCEFGLLVIHLYSVSDDFPFFNRHCRTSELKPLTSSSLQIISHSGNFRLRNQKGNSGRIAYWFSDLFMEHDILLLWQRWLAPQLMISSISIPIGRNHRSKSIFETRQLKSLISDWV